MQQFGAALVGGQVFALHEIIIDEEHSPAVAVTLLQGAVGILDEDGDAAVVGQELQRNLGVHTFVGAAAIGGHDEDVLRSVGGIDVVDMQQVGVETVVGGVVINHLAGVVRGKGIHGVCIVVEVLVNRSAVVLGRRQVQIHLGKQGLGCHLVGTAEFLAHREQAVCLLAVGHYEVVYLHQVLCKR